VQRPELDHLRAERREVLRDPVARVDHERAARAADHLLRLARQLVRADDAGADDPDVERPDRLDGRARVAQPISASRRITAPVRSRSLPALLIASTSPATFASWSAATAGVATAARLIQSCVPEIVILSRLTSMPPRSMPASASGSAKARRSS